MHDWTQAHPQDYFGFHAAWLTALRTALNVGGLPPRYYATLECSGSPDMPDSFIADERVAAMPMHDWARVDPNDYHHFHGRLIYAIADSLNTGVLPPGYCAMAEHTAPPVVPDVIALSEPDGDRHSSNGTPSPRVASGGGVALAVAPPRVQIAAAGRRRPLPARRRIAVRHARGRQLVAVIEVVSPSNKAKAREFADLVSKAVNLLGQGIHLLVVDPFPPTKRDPNGIHGAVWKALTGDRYERPADKPLTLASYASAAECLAFVQPLGAGDALPDMPLFLTPDLYVNVPLEAAYAESWRGYPVPLRAQVEGEGPG